MKFPPNSKDWIFYSYFFPSFFPFVVHRSHFSMFKIHVHQGKVYVLPENYLKKLPVWHLQIKGLQRLSLVILFTAASRKYPGQCKWSYSRFILQHI